VSVQGWMVWDLPMSMIEEMTSESRVLHLNIYYIMIDIIRSGYHCKK